MSKKDNTAKHLDDIDFRRHAERSEAWKEDFLAWHASLHKAIKRDGSSDLLYGQLMMLSHVLWYLLEPKEYLALTRNKIYIDQKTLTPDQKKLYTSMQAFKGSPHCIRSSINTVLISYSQRMADIGKHQMANLALVEEELATKIAANMVVAK